MLPLQICHRCLREQGVKLDGNPLCPVDGVEITVHARALSCPLKKHEGTTAAKPVPTIAVPWPERGAALWEQLHRSALAGELTGDELAAVRQQLPCGECRQHFDAWMRDNRPPTVSLMEPLASLQFTWSVRFHNDVNSRLGRREWTEEEAQERWATPVRSL